MDITYLGHSSFRIRGRKVSLVTDPYDPGMVGMKYPRVNADIVTISHDHKDHNRADLVRDVDRIVDGPGEYEILGVSIIGISTFHDAKKGEQRGRNTIYVIEMDNLRIAHLGDLGQKLSEKKLEEIGTIDVLMLPVGGEYTIGSSEAVVIMQAIEPSVTIPMHYLANGLNKDTFGKLEGVDAFLKEAGVNVEKTPKLSIKKSDLVVEQKIVVLSQKT